MSTDPNLSVINLSVIYQGYVQYGLLIIDVTNIDSMSLLNTFR